MKKLVEELDNGNIRACSDLKVTSRILIDKYEREQKVTNFLADQFKAVQYI